MFVAIGVRTVRDENGNSRSGWQVFHLRPWDDGSGNHEVTLLGFVDSYFGTGWDDMRKHLPGVTCVVSYDLSEEGYEAIRATQESPERMRRVADAVEGN